MKAAQIFFKFAILILFVTVCLSACIAPDTQADDNTPANMILPYDDDGVFIFAPTLFEGHDRVRSSDIVFRYGEGKIIRELGEEFYTAKDFQSHVADLINIMNSINPILADSISTDAADHNIPFEGFTDDNYLYSLHITPHINNVDDYNFRMRVHKAKDFGYLYFTIFKWERVEIEPDFYRSVIRDDLRFHSLYRITLDDLEQIIEFAEGLERGRVQVLVHLPPPPPSCPPPPPPYTMKEDESRLLAMLRNFFNVFSN